ncbi:23S rRNA pseudouridine(2605) synthase RluB [Moraxella sp. ZY21109]|nr:23S rRNA pseudouridine(2605) synthase RluB [Moraxella sp. ZY210820]WLF83241.1 23S rRNA pseudouridine(2605) synthase RluB [Moraxella sp. ZY210820]
MTEKLQKVLARVGLGSRRAMEQMISEGRVSINGRVATLGERVEVGDELRLDGRKIQFGKERDTRRRVVIYYKPEGEICSRHDPEGRPTVFDHLPTISQDRWVMVGRLDINSSGLLLFTNDGELANRLMHPSNGIERQYAVRVMGDVTQQIRQTLLRGVELEDGFAKFESFADLGGEGINRWYQVVVKEGRNREVRRLFESQGLKVSRLLRTRYGIINLPRELRTGRWLELDQLAIDQLAKSVNLSARQTAVFSEEEKRRIDKMLDNPMKARRVEQRRATPRVIVDETNLVSENRPLTRYSPTGKYLGLPETEQSSKRCERSFDDRPRRKFDDNRAKRRERNFDERPRRKFNDNRAERHERNFDERPRRKFDDNRAERRERNFDERPRRKFDDNRAERREHNFDERPKRKFEDNRPRFDRKR